MNGVYNYSLFIDNIWLPSRRKIYTFNVSDNSKVFVIHKETNFIYWQMNNWRPLSNVNKLLLDNKAILNIWNSYWGNIKEHSHKMMCIASLKMRWASIRFFWVNCIHLSKLQRPWNISYRGCKISLVLLPFQQLSAPFVGGEGKGGLISH